MPLIEDAPKKKFKPTRRNSWDLASIMNDSPGETKSADHTQPNPTTEQHKVSAKSDTVVSSASVETGEASAKAGTTSNSPKPLPPTPQKTVELATSLNRVESGAAPESIGSNRVYPGAVAPELIGSNRVHSGAQSGADLGAESGAGSQKFRWATAMRLPTGEHLVLQVLSQLEVGPGEPVYVTRGQLMTACTLSEDGVKSALRRLRQKHLLELVQYQAGAKTGWMSYRVLEQGKLLLAQSASSSIALKNRVQNRVQNQVPNRVLSSSSILDLNKTTNYTEPEFANVDPSPLAKIGFGQTQIAQIARARVLTPQELQDSINGFAFDLEKNQKGKVIKGPPLTFIMGILRNGPYAMPPNYESEEDRSLREYAERSEKKRLDRQQLEKRICQAQFEDWLDETPKDVLVKLVPPDQLAREGSAPHKALVKEYFISTEWPKQWAEIQKNFDKPKS